MKKISIAIALMACVPLYVLAANNEPVQQYHQGEYDKAKEGLANQAANKDKKSAFFLGKMYMQGFGVPKDQVKGIQLITQAAKLGKVEAQMYLAKYYLNEKDNFDEAFGWFKKAAELGDVNAQMFCATAYMDGVGVSVNKEKARKYIIKAAQNGNPSAQYELAKLFLASKNSKNKALGLLWLKKSATKGDSNASYLYGAMLYNGDGLKRNVAQGLKYLKKSASADSKKAGYILGNYFLSLPRTSSNFKEALYWYEKSAELGNTKAQYKLGKLYLNAWGDFKKPQKAVKWLSAAARKGNAKAQLKLATMYSKGEEVRQNQSKAFEWLRKLAEEGNANAQRQVGMMYYRGNGVKEDKSAAIRWLTKAAKNNDYIAKYKLEKLNKEWNNKKKVQQALILTPKLVPIQKAEVFAQNFQFINPTTVSIQEIIKAMGKLEYGKQKPELMIPKYSLTIPKEDFSEKMKAEIIRQAYHGYAKAQFQLGMMYQNGIGVEENLATAISWYFKSAKQNFMRAEYNLGILALEGNGVKKDYKLAQIWLKKAALKGDKHAQYLLGQLYEYGLGTAGDDNYISKNYTAAKAMYGLAAGENSHQAQFSLAQLYISGLLDESYHNDQQRKYHELAYNLFKQAADAGVDEAKLSLAYYFVDHKQHYTNQLWAFNVAKNLAKKNNTKAKFLLALMYDRGVGTKKDLSKATKLYKQVAEKGNPIAQYILGSYYALGLGVSENKKLARSYLSSASYKNLAFAKYNLAIIDYENHDTSSFLNLLDQAVKQHYQPASILLADYYIGHSNNDLDLRKAARIYQTLANNGNVKAQLKLAYMYQNGIYFPKNYKAALQWYQQAASKNIVLAQYALGKMFQIGQGADRDLDKATRWYGKAAKQDFVPAQVALGFINETDRHNYQQAKYWYELAQRQGNPIAKYNLALLYEYGKGVPVNAKKAKELYQRAAQKGMISATSEL